MVNLPVFICITGIPALALYLSNIELIPDWTIGLGLFVGFALAWFVWSIMITKWRIWAFQNVRNVHELKKRAIEDKLIWQDNNWFEKTEIRTSSQNIILKELQEKFKKEDIHKEDPSIPPETKIHYSKTTNFFKMGIMLCCVGVGIYLLLTSKRYLTGSLFTLLGGYFAIKKYKQAANTQTQIIINNKGIETINGGFKNWREIRNEEVIYESSGNKSRAYLSFTFDTENQTINIDDFDISPEEMENALKTYRIRNKKTAPNKAYN